MKNRNVWELFTLMNDSERKRFPHWLEGELMGSQKEVVRLFDSMSRFSQTHTIPTWEEIWAAVPYDGNDPYQAFRKTASLLSDRIFIFLSIQQFRNEPYIADTLGIKALRKRSASPRLFLKAFKKSERKMDTVVWKDDNYYRAIYELECELNIFAQKHKLKGINHRLEEIIYAFDRWWIFEKFKIAPILFSGTSAKDNPRQNFLIEEVKAKVPDLPGYETWKSLHIYEELDQLISGKHSDERTLVSKIQAVQDHVPVDQLHDIYSLISNSYTRKVNREGSEKIIRSFLSIYDWGIQSRLVFEGKYLPSGHFLNLINLSLRINDSERAEQYFLTLKDSISETEKLQVLVFARSLMDFADQKYESVRKALSQIKLSHPIRACTARIRHWQASYEIDRKSPYFHHERRILVKQADSIISYIRNHKGLSRSQKIIFFTHAQYLRKLASANTSNKLERLKKLVISMNESNIKSWLISRIEDRISQDIEIR